MANNKKQVAYLCICCLTGLKKVLCSEVEGRLVNCKKMSWRASPLDAPPDREAYVQFPVEGIPVDVAQW